MHLVDNWRESWRWASMRLALFASTMAGVFVADPWSSASVLFAVVGNLPEPIRLTAAVGVAVLIFAIIAIARLTRKGARCE